MNRLVIGRFGPNNAACDDSNANITNTANLTVSLPPTNAGTPRRRNFHFYAFAVFHDQVPVHVVTTSFDLNSATTGIYSVVRKKSLSAFASDQVIILVSN